MPTLRELIVEIAVMAAVAVALAAIGPFGTFALGSFATRLAYWLPASFAGYAFIRPTMIAAGYAADSLQLPRWFASVAAIMLAAVPMTVFILWLNGNPLLRLPNIEGWFQLYTQVALIGAGVTLLFNLLDARSNDPVSAEAMGAAQSAAADEPSATPPAPFLERLPPHLRMGLVALQMEDHYVRAHTHGGSTLVLLRMRDAVAELGGVEGMQVHRSWWVARDAVEQVAIDGRTMTLILTGGVEAPVARNSMAAVRAAKWDASAH